MAAQINSLLNKDDPFAENNDSNDTVVSKQDFVFEEIKSLNDQIQRAENLPVELHDRLTKMLDRLNRMAKLGHYATEFDTISKYIDITTSVPWGKYSVDKLDLQEAALILDKHHYGMQYVKDRVLEYLSTLILLKQRGKDKEAMAMSTVLLLVGLQGVGKTTISKSIAEALDREFVRIAMGAIGTVLELRGHSKVFPEAEPGQIVKALMKTGVMNPVILLDEIEKASGQEGLMNDIMATLLEVLDPKQNSEFRDHYLDYPVDLSQVLFICSANNTGSLSAALMDRMEIVKMPSYTDQEKIVIARDFLLKDIMMEAGLNPAELEIDPNLWPAIARPFGFDSGIRSLGRTLQSICRKVAKEIVEGKSQKVVLTAENLKYYLPQ